MRRIPPPREDGRGKAELLIAHSADVNRGAAGDRRHAPLDDAIANDNDTVAAVLRKHWPRTLKSGTRTFPCG